MDDNFLRNLIFLLGMDDVMPATALFTTRRDAPVKLRTDDTGPGAMKPLTVSTVLKNTVSKAQNVTALGRQIITVE